MKPFIHSFLKVKQPINHSKKANNNNFCDKSYTKITTLTDQACLVHEEYKQKMSSFAKQMEQLKIKAHILML